MADPYGVNKWMNTVYSTKQLQPAKFNPMRQLKIRRRPLPSALQRAPAPVHQAHILPQQSTVAPGPGPHIPQFPGLENYFNQPTGLTIEQVQDFITKQKKTRGVIVNTVGGQTRTVPVPITGEARFLLGIAFDPGPDVGALLIPRGQISFQLNNEVIIDGVTANSLNLALTTQEYYSFPRYLSGQDTLKLTVADTDTREASFLVYYI